MEALLPGFHQGGLVTLLRLPARPARPATSTTWPRWRRRWRPSEEELAREHAGGPLAATSWRFPPAAHFLPGAEALRLLADRPLLRRHRVWMGTGEPIRFELQDTAAIRGEIEAAHGEEGALLPLTRRLEEWRQRGLAAVVVCSTPVGLGAAPPAAGGPAASSRALHAGPPGEPADLYDAAVHAHVLAGELSGGFVDGAAPGGGGLRRGDLRPAGPQEGPQGPRDENAFAAAFRELNEGDLVVHVEHGIARYLGLTKMQIRGVEGDFLVLAYEGADRLYLPVAKLRQVQKFTGASPEAVRLDRLGGTSFALRKARVKEQLLKMAAELLNVYAARAAHPGHAFPEPDETYREFEAEFPWEETPDQAKAIEDVLRDMRKARKGPAAMAPMDRLVCGDVGYGKTEVAMRAAMLAVLARKQVAVLVPTTVLAEQHERTFRERFKGYPVRIEALSGMKDAERGEARSSRTRPRGRSTSSSAPTGCSAPTWPSRTWGWWWWTRSSASAWRTRSGSRSCASWWTCSR